MEAKLVVGMEIHVQLATRTKLFCGCELAFGDDPNSHVCPVCLGLPGSLPVMNRKAIDMSILAGLALNCQIAEFTKWDRKSYFYPDLPKDYQISQYDLPLCFDGYIDVPLEDGTLKRIRILRAHLEEDAGKNQHEGLPHSRIDLNRTGTPLLEIVTQPDLESPEECRIMAMELQKIVRYLAVSEADMQKGHMRFEPNINLHITDEEGKVHKTPIVEVKNLNSFRAVERAVAYEQWRQFEDWKADRNYTLDNFGKQNRGWDDDRGETVFQREKEEANDYRYFPDPDLVPVVVSSQQLSDIKSQLPELPLAMKHRFIEEYELSDYDAGVLTLDKSTAAYFDQTVKSGASPKRAANLITQYGLKVANERQCTVNELGISSDRLANLAKLVDQGQINASAAAKLFEIMLSDDAAPADLAQKHNLIMKSDTAELDAILDEILAAHANAVADATGGGKKAPKARGFLLGQVMQKTRGQANPKMVGELLDKKLGL